MERDLRIQNGQWNLAASLHYPLRREDEGQPAERYPVVIICHGFVGNRSWTI